MVGAQLLIPDVIGCPRVAGATWMMTTERECTNNAPCLGLALIAAVTLWLGLGSGVAFLVL
jgi:hypothetical protein